MEVPWFVFRRGQLPPLELIQGQPAILERPAIFRPHQDLVGSFIQIAEGDGPARRDADTQFILELESQARPGQQRSVWPAAGVTRSCGGPASSSANVRESPQEEME